MAGKKRARSVVGADVWVATVEAACSAFAAVTAQFVA